MIEQLLQADRLLAVDQIDAAEAIYRRVSELDPMDAIAVVGLARVALARGDDRQAYALASRALEIDPANDMARWRTVIAGDSSYDELVLWYEHDLFDQLNLIQLLTWIHERRPTTKPVSLVCIGAFPGRTGFKGLGELTPAEVASLFTTPRVVADAQYALFDGVMSSVKVPVHHVLGNHDCLGVYEASGMAPGDALYGKAYFLQRFGLERLYHSFDHEGWHFVDVREPDEYAAGHVPGARSSPRGFLEVRADLEHYKRDPWFEDRGRKLVLYCGGGHRSALAAQTLQEMGFRDVLSLAGGWTAWSERGYPVEK